MTLAPGTRLGPYEIIGPIGKGGMGEVWRGRDTKLDRIVAIKVLPASLADDPERLARFEREAKVLASLNHPNIAQIYGVHDNALVMEFVEGTPLSGPVPADTAVAYARQIVDALEAAHDKGIVHRDLKPANILVTNDGAVKVLDFGLAAVTRGLADSGDVANSPTLTQSPSMSGMIMGTAGYMSPEQARGRTVDRRADVWALGVVLYELSTGQKLFGGETTAEVLAEVLKADTNVVNVPAPLRAIVERCLRRDPKLRWQAVGDIRIALAEGMPESPLAIPRARNAKLPWLIAAAMALVTVGTGFISYIRQPSQSTAEPTRLEVDLGLAQSTIASWIAVSPAGSEVAFNALRAGGSAMVMRSLRDGTEKILQPASGNIRSAAFSPDGRSLAFTRVPQLLTMSTAGGAAASVGEIGNNRGLDWARDGFIYFGQLSGPVMRISEKGGSPERIRGSADARVRSEQWPQMLPGNRLLLAVSQGIDGNPIGVIAIDLRAGTDTLLVANAAYGRYFAAADGPGFLVFVRDRSIFASRFDATSAQLEGTPILLGELPSRLPQSAILDVSGGSNQLLAYLTEGAARPDAYQMMFLDAAGTSSALLPAAAQYSSPTFSPDGKTLAFVLNAGQGGDIWSVDLASGAVRQRTFDGGITQEIAWTPDSKHLVYGTATKVWWLRADGSGQPVELMTSEEPARVYSVSPDSRTVAISLNVKGVPDLYFLPLDISDPERPRAGSLQPFAVSPEPEAEMKFSPDGHWIAYTQREARGQNDIDVFVQHYPPNGGKWRVTNGGGRFPTWSRDGRLLYLGPDNRVMSIEWSSSGESLSFGTPKLWSNLPVLYTGNTRVLDLHPDGKRVVAFRASDGNAADRLRAVFVLNPAEDIRRRMALE